MAYDPSNPAFELELAQLGMDQAARTKLMLAQFGAVSGAIGQRNFQSYSAAVNQPPLTDWELERLRANVKAAEPSITSFLHEALTSAPGAPIKMDVHGRVKVAPAPPPLDDLRTTAPDIWAGMVRIVARLPRYSPIGPEGLMAMLSI